VPWKQRRRLLKKFDHQVFIEGHIMKLPRRNFLHLAAGAAVLPLAPYVARAYPSRPVCVIPFPYQIDFAMYGNDVMDLTSAGLRSM
jgi:hypothetical protein